MGCANLTVAVFPHVNVNQLCDSLIQLVLCARAVEGTYHTCLQSMLHTCIHNINVHEYIDLLRVWLEFYTHFSDTVIQCNRADFIAVVMSCLISSRTLSTQTVLCLAAAGTLTFNSSFWLVVIMWMSFCSWVFSVTTLLSVLALALFSLRKY